jgi:hypothetical protein
MNPREANARAYCLSIGLDPDEIIIGWQRHGEDGMLKYEGERWRWYLGATP